MKNTQEMGTLLLRVVLGFTFFMHGLDKVQSGVGNFAEGFPAMGLPAFLAYIVAAVELAGGLALILGLGTRAFSLSMAIIMVGAILFVKLGEGFLGGFELDLILLAIAAHLVLNGSSSLSVDAVILKKRSSHVNMNDQAV
ncbi:DoxX family protein [Oceanobacillus salinisoli]|uniref:DoxX family protein n=1 Tax=Oceanobacillus salinisoli TaxID=2678611 RepID=UPI0012E30282|nr:DoxX family protein [Oceanobacillus salinisoli]